MKNIYMIFALIIASYSGYSQTNTFPASGNVGIGTANPGAPLHVVKSPKAFTDIPMQEWDPAIAGYNLTLSNYNSVHGVDYRFTMFTDGSPSSVLTFQGGNVGIGITDPDSKLTVNGKIRAQEIKVENANWPDYVFTKSYELPFLQETEKQIQETGHLPGIPSAMEVKANGVDLGEMNAKLLKKVEELTLYLIEQQKKNEQQDAHIAALEKKLSVLHTLN